MTHFKDKRINKVTDINNPMGFKMSESRKPSKKAPKVKKHEHDFDAVWPNDGPCVVDGCKAYLKRSMEDNGKWTSEIKDK